MALAKLIILHVLAAPALILGYLYVGLTFITFTAHRLEVDTPEMIVRGHWRPWLHRVFGDRLPSFTLGYGYVLAHHHHQSHELVHVRQFQDISVQGFAIATTFSVITLDAWVLLVWPAMLVSMLTFYLSAWLRGSTDMLREPEHEASAYAQTK